ncbi:hypothetical protein PANT_7d00130 [Moesziomyces antarcticus T-34]|uniref:Uncharacterized protein n=1 Tax=Pseudozyma antarctica (strain T-34) TaxID=1151754 RepID=M9MDD9_PSEA3|nr:hypothetical protein PANT_7d00130 [Moesziomyces antarcticus T-34]
MTPRRPFLDLLLRLACLPILTQLPSSRIDSSSSLAVLWLAWPVFSFLFADALLRALPSQLHRSPYTLITLGASSAQPAAAVRIPHPLLSIPSLSPVVVVPPTHHHHHHPHCRCPHSHRQRVPTGTLPSHHFCRPIDLIVPHSRPRLHLQRLYALFSSYQHRKSCILSIAIYRLSSPTHRPRLLKPVIEIPIATSYCLPSCFSAE